MLGTLGLSGLALFAAGAPAAADPLAGYSASAQGIGAAFAYNIPGIVPVSGNLIEDDVPIARSEVQSGPVVDALGAPWYPGDIAANLGTLLATFGAPPVVPNDPLKAEAQYPPSPGSPSDASFGGTAPSGSPVSPSAFAATSHAGQDGAIVSATLSDLSAVLAPASSSASGVVDVGSLQATNHISIGSSSLSSSATSILKTISIAGIVDISQIDSTSSSSSDGTTGTPGASLRVGSVTVAGVPAYIDKDGVHLSQTSTGDQGLTVAQIQTLLDQTLAQDGLSIRLVDPETTSDSAQAGADSGGVVVTLSRQVYVPFVPGIPAIPVPGLGNETLPSGNYTIDTSVTLGSAVTSVQASSLGAGFGGSATDFSGSTPLSQTANSSGAVLGGALGSATVGGSSPGGQNLESLPATGPGTTAPTPSSSPGFLRSLSHLPGLGFAAPVGWIVAAGALCVLFAYPMLLLARWQFLGRRR